MSSAKSAPQASSPSAFTDCTVSCCCLRRYPREKVGDNMLLDNAAALQPSLFQQLCLCQCTPLARVKPVLELVPQLRGLAGVTVQDGDHVTKGSLQTLKWADFDPQTRVATKPVFGGFGWKDGTAGLWSEGASKSCLRGVVFNLGRSCNYTYKFTFAEDYLSADIDAMANLTGPCCPCVPAWFTLPRFLSHFTMKQDLGSTDGTEWTRYSSKFGGEPTFSYKLLEVYQPDGTPGRHFERLKIADPDVLVTF
ncbi:unnamed protein product [Polarella glacialis]|uniref:Uncharacterized protein n=1 Tax=Polarella glacialis TaxID=89957 RepID=A0A813GX67_POLGL|nr:unnamed protein product [Polarella glacialis]